MENTKKDNSGPINVNGSVTPITRKPIEQITADKWSTMTTGELYEQRSFLQSRLHLVTANSGHPDTIAQMQLGLNRIDAFIAAGDNNDSATMGLI